MIYLQVNQLTKYYGADLILSNIKLEVHSKDRIALVGRNGAGKSTLLKMIVGELEYDQGDIIIPKDIKVGYLPQQAIIQSNLSIWEEMMTVFEPLKQMEVAIRDMETKMGDQTLLSQPLKYEKLLKDYDALQLKYKENGGYQYEANIRSVLHGLSFQDFDYNTPVTNLSGGQKTRLALGKLLLTKPDLLIMDEPTNHLDIETLSWLEQHLQSYPGALLIVSHDRYFLDKVVNKVYEIERKKATRYTGNYTSYLEQKAAKYEQEIKQYEKQQDEISRLESFIARNIARASTTKRAQSRQKQLNRMTLVDKPLNKEKSASFSFDITKQSGHDVLKVSTLSVAYDQKPIFQNVSFDISRAERIALVGPNGVGKSTLLKTILKQQAANSGSITYGTNVFIGYYDQEQANLTSKKRVLDELWDDDPLKPEKDIRTLLGNFLFSGDDVLKIVSELSGGEKARLALAKLMMKKANFLVLDEPTNHLDLDSKEVLEAALIDYPGTLLFVSHDRYFINRIATRVVELSAEGIANYLGDYDYYVMKKAELEELKRLEQEEKHDAVKSKEPIVEKQKFSLDKESKKRERKRQRRIEDIEQQITELEERLAQDQALLCEREVYENHEKANQIQATIEETEQLLESLMEEWEELSK